MIQRNRTPNPHFTLRRTRSGRSRIALLIAVGLGIYACEVKDDEEPDGTGNTGGHDAAGEASTGGRQTATGGVGGQAGSVEPGQAGEGGQESGGAAGSSSGGALDAGGEGSGGSDRGGATSQSVDGGAAGATQAPSTGAGGDGTDASCGNLMQACCSGETCQDDLVCLDGASCSCVQALAGQYIIRTDGILIHQSDPTSNVQTPVLDADSATPLLGATTVSQGESHACAVLEDATVWCWPTATNANASGQLGNGTTDTAGPLFRATQVLTAANKPLAEVVSLSGVSSRWAGNTCAVTSDHELYCWGNLTWTTGGGTNTANPYASKVTTDGVTPFTNVIQVSVDYANACAIVEGESENELWCWGSNGSGQLGTGDTVDQRYPTKVLGISNPTQVVVSNNGYGSFACAIEGSNLRCWGSNDTGQIGNETVGGSVSTPTLVTLPSGKPLEGIVQVEAASQDNIRSSACALTVDQTILCWGNGFGAPAPYGVGNVVSLGSLVYGGVRFLTSDGVYHFNTATRDPNCGPI